MACPACIAAIVTANLPAIAAAAAAATASAVVASKVMDSQNDVVDVVDTSFVRSEDIQQNITVRSDIKTP